MASTLRLMVVLTLIHISSAVAGGMGGGGGMGGDNHQLIDSTWIKGLRAMTAQLIAARVHVTGMIGGFIDGQSMNDAQLTMKQLEAEALRDYTPGENLCRFGTLSRGLGGSNDRTLTANVALQTIMMNRETHNNHRSRPYGDLDDLARLHNLSTLYCNPGDNDRTPAACNCDLAAGTCDASGGPLAQRSNRDLDFARLFDTRLTLKLNLSDDKLTPDEQDVLAFLSNLSAFNTIPAIPAPQMSAAASPVAAKTFMDIRAVVASRSVVRSSLAAQIARRAEGTDAAAPFLLNALEELGMTKDEAKRYLRSEGFGLARNGSDASEVVAPSYEAQMEVLTKKLYQNPNFYTNLVDKPANVDRTRAAMLATQLMQRRDLKESLDRREMLLSQLLELSIRDEEKRMNKRIGYATSSKN